MTFRIYLSHNTMGYGMLSLLMLLLASLQVDQVYSGSIHKRATHSNDTVQIQKIIDDIGGRKKVDLILVMDRSHGMSKQTFYLQQKKLVQAILKQYASLYTSYVRLSVITFARDVTTVLDSVSNPDNTPNKCTLFNDIDNKWDADVVYTQNKTDLKGTNMKDAFLRAREIFQAGSKHRTNQTRILLLLSDGKYNSAFDPINEAKELKATLGVSIYGVGIGTWLEIGNVREVTSLYGNSDLYGSYQDWESVVAIKSDSLISYTPDTPQTWAYMNSCTDSCMPNSNCYCDIDRGLQQCRCKPGYFLNESNASCDECPLHTYKAEASNEGCTPCPPATITDETASVQAKDCYCLVPPCNDPCENATCNDHQECRALNETHATCICKDGWEGDDCNNNPDACIEHGKECLHESRCVDGLGKDVFTCVCRKWGYSGRFCEINQDECTPDMCVNNSTCTDRTNNFQCMCTDDWHGRYCQDLKTTTLSTTTVTTIKPTNAASTAPDNTLWIIIGASVGGGLLIIILIVVTACCVCNKRKEKNKEEVKNIAQQFSGFWKKRTIRGSKYVKEMEEDANGGLPSAPSEHRPDLIEGTGNAYTSVENLKNEEYATIPYETVTLKTGMESWQNYITELESSKVIDCAMIAKINGDKRALTSAWMYDPGEQTRVQELMEEPDDNVPLLLQDGEYHIQENDGTLAVGRTIGSSQEPKTVAIGKTKTYLIIAIAPAETDAGKTRKEVQWIVDHISSEGY